MISALILAAGQSKRMGQPKMLLPWGEVTVIEHVISIFANANVDDILVVTGGAREQVEEIIEACKGQYPVRSVYNERYEDGEMLSSIQCGIQAITPFRISSGEMDDSSATLIGLGDQPQIQERSVRLVMEAYQRMGSPLVVPSYQMRRGHPWLVASLLWDELLEMSPDQTPRDFLNKHASVIHYVNVETADVLADLDTPDDYRAARP